jgi:hypothetical protein
MLGPILDVDTQSFPLSARCIVAITSRMFIE